METTLIQNISLKDFLSNIKAEAELTIYLAAMTTDHNKFQQRNWGIHRYIEDKTNGNNFVPSTLDTHSQEEADTLLLYHAL